MSRPSPRTLRRAAIAGGLLAGLAVPSAAYAADPSSQAVVLQTDNKISTFETAHPEEGTTPVGVSGLTAGDTLVGIDTRPQNGYLYGLGYNATAKTIQLYSLSTRKSGATPAYQATPVGAAQPITGATADSHFGFDFNPTVDRIRVVTDTGQNLRLNPNTGAIAFTDGAITPADSKVDGAAYTDNKQNATKTALYTISAANSSIYIQNPPNDGAQSSPKTVTLSGAKLPFSAVGGFDIPAGVDSASANTAPPAGKVGIAALKVNGVYFLTSIDLSSGAVAGAGVIGGITGDIVGLAVQQETTAASRPAISLIGKNVRRFDATTPGTGVTVPIVGLNGDETPVALDWRPQTGQLFMLGIDAGTKSGTLYRLDPQTATTDTPPVAQATATPIGTPGSITLADAAGAALALPATGYDIDFNPTSDRLRVVASTGGTDGRGLNFRINPNDAVVADTNTGVAGNQPDAAQNGATGLGTDVGGTAYTNPFGQSLTGGVTTQYGISAATDQLQVQVPPNDGTQTAGVPLKVGADKLDVTSVKGFDIPPATTSTAAAGPASGIGVAALTTSASTSLYAIDLASGAAGALGALDAGTTSVTIGDGPAPLKTRTTTPPPAGGGTGGSTGGGTTTPPLTPTVPTKPTTPVTPAKAAFASSTRITLKLRASRVSRKGPAKVTYRNTNKFAVKARFTATTPKSGKRKAIKYRTKSFTLKASKSRTLNVALPSAAQRVLRSKKKLTIKVTLRVTAPNGKSRNVRKTLTVRLKK